MYIHQWVGEPVSEPEPGVFGSFEPEPLEKNQEPESLGKKSQEPDPQIPRAGAA